MKSTHFIGRLKMRCRPLICPFEEILGYLPDGVSSFDVGCGTGYLLSRIAVEKKPTALGGIEIDARLVAFATEKIRQVSPNVPLAVTVFDGRNLPDTIAQYDYLWMIDVLHHIPVAQQAEALRALAAKMKPGATLIFKDIDAGRPILCLANKLHDLLSAGEISHELTRVAAADLLRQAGFELAQEGVKRMIVYPHYWYVCRKP